MSKQIDLIVIVVVVVIYGVGFYLILFYQIDFTTLSKLLTD